MVLAHAVTSFEEAPGLVVAIGPCVFLEVAHFGLIAAASVSVSSERYWDPDVWTGIYVTII